MTLDWQNTDGIRCCAMQVTKCKHMQPHSNCPEYTTTGVHGVKGADVLIFFAKYTMFHKIGTPLYFGNSFFKC